MDLFDILFQYCLPLTLLYLSYRYIWRGAKSSIIPWGWGSLSDYRTATMPTGGWNINMRIGSQTYTMRNIRLLVATEGLYLQRRLLGSVSTLLVPYAQISTGFPIYYAALFFYSHSSIRYILRG